MRYDQRPWNLLSTALHTVVVWMDISLEPEGDCLNSLVTSFEL